MDARSLSNSAVVGVWGIHGSSVYAISFWIGLEMTHNQYEHPKDMFKVPVINGIEKSPGWTRPSRSIVDSNFSLFVNIERDWRQLWDGRDEPPWNERSDFQRFIGTAHVLPNHGRF